MTDFPADIYTEPEDDVGTLKNLGPLTGMAGAGGRVAPGRCLPGAPTDPDVRDSRIRLFETRVCYAGQARPGVSSG